MTQDERLIAALRELKASTDADWLQHLPARKAAEATHHDLQREQAVTNSLDAKQFREMHGNKKFYSTTAVSRDYLEAWLRRNVAGGVAMDYACGSGTQVIQFAKLGARLAIGIDISDVSIRNAEEAAKAQGVADACFFLRGDCENTGLPAESVDVILCSGVLHHMDLSYAYPEMRRLLRPGGRVLALEALAYNPLIRLYRLLTPKMRTAWEREHILSMREVRFARWFFEVREVRFWHLFSILGTWLRNRPALFNPAMKVLNGIDRAILRVPGLRLWAWQFTFELVKRDETAPGGPPVAP